MCNEHFKFWSFFLDGDEGKRREGLSSTTSISKKPRLKEDESSSALLQPNSSTVFDSDIGLYIGKQVRTTFVNKNSVKLT